MFERPDDQSDHDKQMGILMVLGQWKAASQNLYHPVLTALEECIISVRNVASCCVQGIRKTHHEFLYAPYMNMQGTRALHGWSAIGDPSNSDDCLGHGTHTAASAGGLTYGVAKNVTLWAGTAPTMHTIPSAFAD